MSVTLNKISLPGRYKIFNRLIINNRLTSLKSPVKLYSCKIRTLDKSLSLPFRFAWV